jgi:hypothetical protein
MSENKIVIQTKIAALIPPYEYANIQIEKRIEIHGSLECSEVLAFEQEATEMGIKVRDKNGDLSLRLLDAAVSEFTVQRFLKLKAKIDKLPDDTWSLREE